MPFTLGIVGCGAIGNVHAETARRAGITIGGAWDVMPSRADALVKTHGGRAMPSLAGLLSMNEIDAVAIAVPNDRHRECAEASLRAGKHVLLEKPMALSASECDEILAAAKESRGRLQVGLLCRGAPATLAMKTRIDAGELGRISHLKVRAYRQRGIPGLGGWFTTKAHSGGGPLIDLGVHVLDVALHLCGSPRVERVSGITWARFGSPIADYRYTDMWAGPPRLDGTFDVEDAATALLRCAGGVSIELTVTWATNAPSAALKDGITIWGSKGGGHFEVLGKSIVVAREVDGAVVDAEHACTKGNALDEAWDQQYRNFSRLVTRGGPACAPGVEARALQAAIDAIYESSRLGREVEVSLG